MKQQELTEQIRLAIADSGNSLNQLGAVCGIDRGRLSRFMRGERDLTLRAASQLCRALGLTVVKIDQRSAESSAQPRKLMRNFRVS